MTSFSFRITALVSCILALVPFVLGGDVVCKNDPHATRCVMCKESDLGQRWAKYRAKVEGCANVGSKATRVDCYCTNYGQLSYAWSLGTCCSEYAPMLAVTANFCNLKTYHEDMISDQHLEDAVADAKRVADTIWHNDSGWDIPKATTFIQPYGGGSTTSYETSATQKGSAPVTHVSYKSELLESSQKTQSKDTKSPVAKPQEKEKHEHPKSLSLQSKVEVHLGHATNRSAESKKQADPSTTTSSDTVHHHAKTVDKCQGKKSGCCETDRQKYHRSRASHRTNMQRFSKRDKNIAFNPRVTSHKLSKRGGCGTAFNGVQYPLSVPDTVLQVYKMI